MTMREFLYSVVPVTVALLAIGFGVAACDARIERPPPQPALLVEIVELPHARSVECVRFTREHLHALSCNWEAANGE